MDYAQTGNTHDGNDRRSVDQLHEIRFDRNQSISSDIPHCQRTGDSTKSNSRKVKQMTPEELKTLIESDAEATALFAKPDDAACAARCREIAPAEVVDTYLTELQIVALYEDPTDAETTLQTIESVAQANPIVKRVAAWTKPGAAGVNFGDHRVRAMLTLSVDQGGLGLSADQAGPLLSAAERSANIAESDIEKLRTGT